MQIEHRMDAKRGNLIWLSDGRTEAAAALDFGIRIVHLSCAGKPNLFYSQPDDLSDGLTTEAGWRISEYTRDLLHSEMAEGNVMTEYEAKFSAQGKPICKLVAVR